MNIERFCAEEDGRYPLSKPWVLDGWRYATDGSIAVREPTKDADSERVIEPVMDLFAAHPLAPRAFGWPAIPTHDGAGVDHLEAACMVGLENDATKCEKFGRCEATGDHECANKVKWRLLDAMPLGDRHYQGLYIDLINKELPGAKYAVADNGMLVFYHGDVEGVLGFTKS